MFWGILENKLSRAPAKIESVSAVGIRGQIDVETLHNLNDTVGWPGWVVVQWSNDGAQGNYRPECGRLRGSLHVLWGASGALRDQDRVELCGRVVIQWHSSHNHLAFPISNLCACAFDKLRMRPFFYGAPDDLFGKFTCGSAIGSKARAMSLQLELPTSCWHPLQSQNLHTILY